MKSLDQAIKLNDDCKKSINILHIKVCILLVIIALSAIVLF